MTADIKARLKVSAWMQQCSRFPPLRKVSRIGRQLTQPVDVAKN